MTTVDVVDPQSGEVLRQPIPLDEPGSSCVVKLQALPGVSAVQIRVRDGETPVMFAEVECSHLESIDLHLSRSQNGRFSAESGLRNIYFLPNSLTAEPALLLPSASRETEIALLVDATALDPKSEASGPKAAIPTLLQPAGQPAPAWNALARKLQEFVVEAQRILGSDMRSTVLAFGDYQMQVAPDSVPVYPLHGRALRAMAPEQIFEALTRIPRIAGGDYVDALADAMELCRGRGLGWSDGTRKLLIVLGNSPGYSVVDAVSPALELADAHIRVADVYEQAAELHRKGIEIVTIFHDDGMDRVAELSAVAANLVEYARSQYVRLATRPEWAFSTRDWKPHQAARVWAEERSLAGRGACPGVWLG